MRETLYRQKEKERIHRDNFSRYKEPCIDLETILSSPQEQTIDVSLGKTPQCRHLHTRAYRDSVKIESKEK